MNVDVKAFDTKAELYGQLLEEAKRLAGETKDAGAVLANMAALLTLFLDQVNWAGFYLLRDGRLVVGPFQGKPAVPEIAVGSGVCGTAAAARVTQIVADVHKCTNHIACDLSSSSEIVVPIMTGDRFFGVIDIDSPVKGRFDEEDAAGLEKLAAFLAERMLRGRKEEMV